MTELQDKLQQLRELLEASTISPAYAPLLEVVDEPDWWPNALGMKIPSQKPRCWDNMPKGALAGALVVATHSLIHIDFEGDLMMGYDPDNTALDAVIEALEQEVK